MTPDPPPREAAMVALAIVGERICYLHTQGEIEGRMFWSVRLRQFEQLFEQGRYAKLCEEFDAAWLFTV